ncbi:hypothetical protein ATJ88_3152 [Isoptericola jiangsuensis]|uniref:ABC transporter family protein n=1 Tax=Isoptericola jiangsuensis TaxID=548579 RepID=A0A2A9EZX9_9MICO|nr:hypothetical protein [Isoptericola jiangsuensis]PFG44428.1 hypothetical protein ATJ88_3152 [Isoptericola jiangsuensis]
MQVVLDRVTVDGRREPMLATMDLGWSTREAVLVAAEPGHGHTALALVATGRLAPSSGRVLVDGVEARPAALRAASAVVDVPGVNEPDDALTLADVVAEGLALAGRRSRPRDVRQFLDERALSGERGRRVDQLPAPVRTAVLAGLATADPAVRFVVLTLPDRHGGDPADWWDLARGLAADGLGVLVECTRSSARDLGVDLPPAVGDSLHEPPRVVARAVAPAEPAALATAPDADADGDGDAEVGVEHDSDAETDVETDPDVETDIDLDADDPTEPPDDLRLDDVPSDDVPSDERLTSRPEGTR